MQNKTEQKTDYYGNVPRHIEYPSLSMYGLIKKVADENPDLFAIDFMDKKMTYCVFLSRIDKAAEAISDLGIKKGDRVSLLLPNCPQALIILYAINKLGAVSNIIHPLSVESEIEYCIRESSSKIIFTFDSFVYKTLSAAKKTACVVVGVDIMDELPWYKKPIYYIKNHRHFMHLRRIILMGQAGKLGKNRIIARKHFKINTRELLLSAPSFETDASSVDDEPAIILYSGGTTGVSKGVLLSNRNFNALGLQTASESGLEDTRRLSMLAIMPLFHGFGLGVGVHAILVAGGECILVPRFSLKEYVHILKTKKPNFLPGVPTLFEALLDAEKEYNLDNVDLSFLKGVYCGGDTLTQVLRDRVDAFLRAHNAKVQIREGYGMTECVGASCLTPTDYYRKGSIGLPFPDTVFKIVDLNTLEEKPFMEEGEIVMRGPTVMLGYLNNPEETKNALRVHPDGLVWLHSGDLGAMDEDGFIYFKQRIKRMIITSGYNVYPVELEKIIADHPFVRECCVVGVPDEYRGHRVKVYVIPEQGVQKTEAVKKAIKTYCREKLVRYAVPREISFVDEFPRTKVGKIDYKSLEN